MRKELKKLNGHRDLFTAKIVKEGTKSSFRGATLLTILLKDVKRVSDGKLMCDHLWLNKTKAFTALDLSVGLEVQFVARVKAYTKGYMGKKEYLNRELKQDFKLSYPTNVEVVESQAIKDQRSESKLIVRKNKNKGAI